MDPFLARIESFKICFMNSSTENMLYFPLLFGNFCRNLQYTLL